MTRLDSPTPGLEARAWYRTTSVPYVSFQGVERGTNSGWQQGPTRVDYPVDNTDPTTWAR